jgi:hypothetical protein
MHSKHGQTIGKRIGKVKVVDHKTENDISFKQAFLRDAIPITIYVAILVYLLFMVFTGKLSAEVFNHPPNTNRTEDTGLDLLVKISSWWYIAEIITMLTNKKRRAIHDFIAGTVVVRLNFKDESVLDKSLTDKPMDNIAYADIPDDLSEVSQCIICGEAIPKEMDSCPSCGWTYKEVIKEV